MPQVVDSAVDAIGELWRTHSGVVTAVQFVLGTADMDGQRRLFGTGQYPRFLLLSGF